MELRRHKDIVAVKTGTSRPIAFHARNLAVAELTDDAWSLLPPTALRRSEVLALSDLTTEAASEIAAWETSEDPEVLGERDGFAVRSLTLNVTQICNLHCTYCAAGGDGTYGDPVRRISIEKTLPQLKFFLDQVPDGESFHIAFLGGEPLLYAGAIHGIGLYVLDEARRRDLKATFKVTTNGTLVNDRALAALKALKADVVVSMDGPAELHDRQRLTKDGRGSFEAVRKGLGVLLDERADLGQIGVHAVFNDRNLEVEKAWDFFADLGVDFMEFTFSVDDAEDAVTRIFNDGMAKAAEKAWAKGGEAELRRIGNFDSIFQRLDGKRRLENHCGLGKSMLVVDSRNRLWSCPWTVGREEDRLGEGTELDYGRLENLQQSLIERNRCGDCWARFVCGGGCSYVHGSTASAGALNKKTDYCERTRFLVALALVYYHQARTAEAG